jgi:putative permease
MNRLERSIRRERTIQLMTVVALIGAAITVLVTVNNLLVSFVLALVVNYLLGPSVSAFERSGLSRTWSIFISYILVSLIFAWSVYSILPLVSSQFHALRTNFPSLLAGATRLANETQLKIDYILGGQFELSLTKNLEQKLPALTSGLFEGLPQILTKLFTTLLLAPFLAFFMLLDGRSFARKFLNLVPNNVFELVLNLQHQINEQIGGFIRARLLEAGIVGLVVWIGLAIIGFPYAFLLAVFAGVTNLIPYIGPLIGAVPALLIAMISSGSFYAVFLVTLVYFIAQLIDMVFIIPLVVAKIVDLHPVSVIIAIVLGAQLLGVLGMIISIPLASALKVTFQAVYRHLVEFRS